MDVKQFDQLTRHLTCSTTRRSSIRALVGGVVGLGVAASETSAKKKKRPSQCKADRRCGDLCCQLGHECVLGRCQRTQNSCLPNDAPCGPEAGNNYACCDSSYLCRASQDQSSHSCLRCATLNGWCVHDNDCCSDNNGCRNGVCERVYV